MSKKKAHEVKRLEERIRWLERPGWPCAMVRDVDLAQSERNEIAKEQEEIAKEQEYVTVRLGWSKKRLSSFQKLFAEYQRSSSITTYLKIRRAFPEVEIYVRRFLTHTMVFEEAFEDDLKRLRIDKYLIRRLNYGPDEPALDALCLRLLELLVERDALPKNGPNHIDQRRTAISDAFLNYVITIILELFERPDDVRYIPSSLVLLMRRLLCGENPDLYEAEINGPKATICGAGHCRRTERRRATNGTKDSKAAKHPSHALPSGGWHLGVSILPR